jgi:uncharacterized phage protein (TIGR01671 family)
METVYSIHASGSVHIRGGRAMLRQSECEIMQSTGLHDKNGEEVYEDDIVAENFENEMGSFQPGTGRIVWCKDCVAFHVRTNDQPDDAVEGYSLGSDCEVIGNIYENPELLSV